MILKKKQLLNSNDPLQKAGEEAEAQMAYLLERRFGNRNDVFVINDLRIAPQESPVFQIDHLVVSRFGFFIVESKSVHSTITITRWDDQREHWQRAYRGISKGMDSPVLQAGEQARLLKDFLRDNTELLLGKMLGMQKGFRYCPVIPYVAISSTGIIEMAKGEAPPESVFKADEIAPMLDAKLRELEKKVSLMNLSLDTGWDMTLEEALRTAEFLVNSHTPLREGKPAESVGAILHAGSDCPACKTRKLVNATAKQPDGSRVPYLACEGNRDKSCSWHMRVEMPEVVDTSAASPAVTSSPTQDSSRSKGSSKSYYCNKCKAPISPRVFKYCLDHESRFGGKPYCMDCQKSFPSEA